MGTRADFYQGIGTKAVWLGSTAWDGYPQDKRGAPGVPQGLLNANTFDKFKAALKRYFKPRDDVTLPAQGWPWPWDDSATTDCSYWFHDGQVYISSSGRALVPWSSWKSVKDWRGLEPGKLPGAIKRKFPNMKKIKKVRLDEGSGLMWIGARS